MMVGATVSASAGVMNSLLGKLSTLLDKEYTKHKNVEKDVMFLQRELPSMEAVLQKHAMQDELDVQLKAWVSELRELAYDIEDSIDAFMVRIEHYSDESAGIKGFMSKKIHKLKKLRCHHKFSAVFLELKERVVEANERRRRYEVDGSTSGTTTSDLLVDSRLPALYSGLDELVGIKGPRDCIIKLLTYEADSGPSRQQLKVVSIVGCGGLGKTTLANQVYKEINGQFDCKAFVSMSQKPDMRKILMDLLSQILRNGSPMCFDEQRLIDKLREFLKDKRYLIVIDDIWSTSAWEIVKSAFPDNNLRSRIITTTRIMDVAKSCSANLQEYVYTIKPLNHQDSSKLFFKKIFPSGCGVPQHLKEVSNAILKKCGGLPLAILIIAGLLASKYSYRKDEWEAVHNSIGSELGKNHTLEGFRRILMLSFYDLPHDLKTCFLYLSIFPEDDLIVRKQLVWKWVAEGFIRKERGKRPDQVAESYFYDLINRNMIQAVGVQYKGNIYGCRVHDLVLDLIRFLSAQINFVIAIDDKGYESSPRKIRRLSLQASNLEDQEMQKLVSNQSHIRSLIMFRAFKQAPDLFKFHALRILDLSECSCLEDHHITCIVNMFQLRYLSLPCRITELPEQTGNLQHLEVLNIRRCMIKRLPESVVKLGKLMCLHVKSGVKLPDEIGRMQALQELESISIPCNSVRLIEEIGRLTRLRRLTVETTSTTEKMGDQEVRFREMLVSSLTELGRNGLESLCISYPHGQNFILDSLSGSCCSLPKLHELDIKNYLCWVPRWLTMLSSLVHLCLSMYDIDEEDMRVLNGISTLLFLRLELRNPPEERLVIGCDGLRHLNELHVFCQHSAMPLTFAPGAMPELHHLRLEFGARETLRMYGDFDFGIEHLSGLRDIRVDINYYSGGTDMDAEAVAAKDAITTASIIHPNRPLHDVRMHVTMMFTLKEAAQSVGLQSATKELNVGTDVQRTFVQIEDLDNPEVLRKLQQLLSRESSTRNQ
ncbi:disease resistance protein RGA5-like [Oryza glaberrima]|uniref:disease resistance protein RGA5-like n=1 Tax=Oryza glaberrima TaxID=4538 RepID=UPI00224C3B04|nr:disease resistance protein RGA5-like [Oryza glaberrima]